MAKKTKLKHHSVGIFSSVCVLCTVLSVYICVCVHRFSLMWCVVEQWEEGRMWCRKFIYNILRCWGTPDLVRVKTLQCFLCCCNCLSSVGKSLIKRYSFYSSEGLKPHWSSSRIPIMKLTLQSQEDAWRNKENEVFSNKSNSCYTTSWTVDN